MFNEIMAKSTNKTPIPQNEDEIMITLPLKKFVHYVLGQGYWHDKPIDEDIAAVIEAKTGNQIICYIQHADELSPNLDSPILWNLEAWKTNTERWLRAKRWSDSERAKRNIFEANMKIVTRAVEQELALRGEAAIGAALALLKQNNMNKLRILGISKLIKQESEIP